MQLLPPKKFPCRWHRETNFGAFTLTELLVVVSIIAILIALALGAITSVLERSRGVKCANNLRSIGMAAMQYINDNEAFPSTTKPSWDMKLINYLGISSSNSAAAIFICPSDHRPVVAGSFPRSYTLSKIREPDDGDGLVSGATTRSISEVDAPSRTILATEWFTDPSGQDIANYQYHESFGAVKGWLNGGNNRDWPRLANGRPYHGRTMNFVFADGHLESMAPSDANTPVDLWTAKQKSK